MPVKQTLKLAMSLLVRDEADIVLENILYHAAQGVDYFIVTDNGSTDGTRESLEILKDHVNLHVIDQPIHTIDQDVWVTEMAQWLARHTDADWVINNDADEFWVTDEQCLPSAIQRDLFESKNLDVGVLSCSRYNYLPSTVDINQPNYRFYNNRLKVIRDMDLVEGATTDNVLITLQGEKVIGRLDGLVSVGMGNHKALHSASCAKSKYVTIAHYPLRSYEQFKKKVINHGSSIDNNKRFGPQTNWHLRDWYSCYQKGVLRNEYDKYVLSPKRQLDLLADGVIVQDSSNCNLMAKFDQFPVSEMAFEASI